MSVVIITGASKGYGRAIAIAFAGSATFCSNNSHLRLILISRDGDGLSTTEQLCKSACSCNTISVESHAIDLSQPSDERFQQFYDDILRGKQASEYGHAILINNAGSLGRLARVRDLSATDVSEALSLNVASPIVLTRLFLKAFAGRKVDGKSTISPTVVVNISSLAAIQEFDCWGLYSAGKAARELFFKTVALEEDLIAKEDSGVPAQSQPTTTTAPSPEKEIATRRVAVLNYAPGPLDTEMQREIRQEMPDVPLKKAFTDMFEQGKLVDPNDSATVLIRLIVEGKYVAGEHVDYFDVK
ncbi:hypothetical protein HDU76_004508 [Blyttiomyces sp. JEL0837]|nr:hypothetical protein HDU76_004508 [Blyttiomyces sp. JEL0837]